MAGYRLYVLGGEGAFERVSELDASDDAAAIDLAATKDAPRMELWCGRRMVETWNQYPPAPGPERG